MSFTIELGLNKDFLWAIDLTLRHQDYDQAVVLGRGLAEFLQAEHGDYWGSNLIQWRGRMVEVYLASSRLLSELVSRAKGKVSARILDDLYYVEGKVGEF